MAVSPRVCVASVPLIFFPAWGFNTLAFDEKFDQVNKLIIMGKEKGYLLYDEVNDLLPSDVHSPEDLDDLLSTFESEGIEVLEAPRKAIDKLGIVDKDDLLIKADEVGEEMGELDLTPGVLDKTNDPVRMYLREMGTVPLLTREGEVEIAKRIERGQLNVFKALSRSPIVVQELLELRDQLSRGEKSIKEVVGFNDDELTEERVTERLREVVDAISDIDRMNKKLNQIKAKKESIPRSKKPREYRRYSWGEARQRILISKLIRAIEFTHAERKRLMDRIREAVDELTPVEREVSRLERRIESSRTNGNKDLKKELKVYKAKLSEFEEQNHRT